MTGTEENIVNDKDILEKFELFQNELYETNKQLQKEIDVLAVAHENLKSNYEETARGFDKMCGQLSGLESKVVAQDYKLEIAEQKYKDHDKVFNEEYFDKLTRSTALADIRDELQKSEKNKFEALKKIEKIKAELSAAKLQEREMRNSLAFKIGASLANLHGKGVMGWIKSPLAVYRVVARFKKQKKDNEKKGLSRRLSMEKAVGSGDKGGSNCHDVKIVEDASTDKYNFSVHPIPKSNSIAFDAFNLSREHGYDFAVHFMEKYGRKKDQYVTEMFKANLHIDNDKLWLKHFNSYLSQFSVEPLSLTPGNEPRFFRLSTPRSNSINSGPLVSVIMPAFNSEATIEHSVNSILDQTWKNLELIIVDDCSDDSTWACIERLASSDSRIKVLRNKVNVGPYVSKNRALKLVEGDYITGHDADDWAHPHRIEKHVRLMQRNPDIKASLAKMIRVDVNCEVSQFAKEGKTSSDGVIRLASISCFFETEFFRQYLGHWDIVRFGADSELIERTRTILGSSFVTFDLVGMICLDLETSLTNDAVHGVSKVTGISDVRRYYRDQWQEWHKTISLEQAYLDFPQKQRKFDAPSAALNNEDVIEVLLQ